MEIEYKFLVDSDKAMGIMAYLEREYNATDYDEIMMEADYMDTLDSILREHKVALRKRRENDKLMATVKWSGEVKDGAHMRHEVNIPLNEGEAITHTTFKDSHAYDIMDLAHGKSLETFMKMKFLRRQFNIKFRDCKMVVSYDEGYIVGENGSFPISELEVELVEGGFNNMRIFTSKLKSQYGLEPCSQSKYERGIEGK